MNNRLLYLLTRTPLHVTSGIDLGPLDLPTQRERHTNLPVIPGAVLKSGFSSLWTQWLPPEGTGNTLPRLARTPAGAWLFGSGDPANPAPGAVQFSEARLLAFPVRSARAGFAWITCPLILRRFARDGGMKVFKADGSPNSDVLPVGSLRDDQVLINSPLLAIGERVVLEEYSLFRIRGEGGRDPAFPPALASELSRVMTGDPVWGEIAQRLAIVSDGLMSFLSQTACDVMSVDRGLAPTDRPAYQENVPAETMFYSVVSGFDDRDQLRPKELTQPPLEVLAGQVAAQGKVLQIGADAGNGLGYCTVEFQELSPSGQ